MSETSASPKRQRIEYEDGKDDHPEKYNKGRDQEDQNSYPRAKRKREELVAEEEEGKDEESGKSKSDNGVDSARTPGDTARREHTLVMRLTNKEQELQEALTQMGEMKQAQTQNTAQLRSMLLDPAINLVFQRLAREVEEHKDKLKQKQNELSAWKFTPDSQTGMRLMAKCRMLLQENGDLGKMISSGRTARLEGEIALHKALVAEMKTNQKELDEFVGELEEDVEGMQGMIFLLQQQLKEARAQVATLQAENAALRQLRHPPLDSATSASSPANPSTQTASSLDPANLSSPATPNPTMVPDQSSTTPSNTSENHVAATSKTSPSPGNLTSDGPQTNGDSTQTSQTKEETAEETTDTTTRDDGNTTKSSNLRTQDKPLDSEERTCNLQASSTPAESNGTVSSDVSGQGESTPQTLNGCTSHSPSSAKDDKRTTEASSVSPVKLGRTSPVRTRGKRRGESTEVKATDDLVNGKAD